ncbi:MAG: response regulator [Myxococcales bacterium]|nr:response regulator [Myxococcales bacterium]
MAQRNVLVVDDDAEIRDYLALALRALGHHVQVAAHPDAVAAGAAPDVALVDLLVPDGASVAPLVARLAATGCRVVLITGLSLDAPVVQSALAAGAQAVLQKPFSLDAVRAEVG